MRKPVLPVVAATMLLVAGLSSAFAQTAPPAVRIGVVDLELVGRKFDRKAKEEEALTQWYVGRQSFLQELDKYIFCVDDEWKQVLALLDTPKGQRTPEQDAQLKALLDEGTKRETRYKDLEAKQAQGALTKDEENSLKELRETPTARTADLRNRAENIENELQQRMAAIREALMKPVRDAVNAIAAERGFALVLEKDWVYFGGEDITEDVIKKVNEMAPPPAGTAVPPQPGTPPAGGEKPKEGDGGKPPGGGNP
ncbi:MAG: OmpH family outer membrane protein [Armatimonadetes bacterium]|nr:OmpH family outer membrane protein [Armatimonadota bacterium]